MHRKNKALTARAYLNMADICFQQKQYTEALVYYDKTIECSKNNGISSIAYNNRGVIYYIKNNHTQALSDFKQSTRFHPDAMSYLNLAKLYDMKKNFINALSGCVHALIIEPDNQECTTLLYKILQNECPEELFKKMEALPKDERITVMSQAINKTTRLGRWVNLKTFFLYKLFFCDIQTEMKIYYRALTRDHTNVSYAAIALGQADRQNWRMGRNYNAFFGMPTDLIKKIAIETADDLPADEAMKIVNNNYYKPTLKK